jgi:hypothetical protein
MSEIAEMIDATLPGRPKRCKKVGQEDWPLPTKE